MGKLNYLGGKHIFLLVFFAFLGTQNSFCQISKYNIQSEVGTYLSTSGRTPFWLRTNNYGITPLESQIVTLRSSLSKDYDSTKTSKDRLKKFGVGYGLNMVGNLGLKNQFLLPEAFVKLRVGIFEVFGGRRKEIYGLIDSTLSSGSYIWSGNAMPLPKFQISIPNYVSILGKGLISIKGNFSHGFFGNQSFVQGYYLHQKSIYGKIGKPNWKLNLLGGFNHQVQWGGFAEGLKGVETSSQNGFLPSDFNTLMSVAFPLPFVRKIFPPKIAIAYDYLNYGGNQLGSVDLAAQLKLKKVNIFIYRQIPYELGSLFTSLVNADDGLYGVSVNFKNKTNLIHKFTIEGFHSFNQGGYRSGIARLLNIQDRHFGELHGYLNHGQYQDGWSYNKIGIGTPLILSDNELKIDKPTGYFSAFNRVKSIYGACEGKFRQVDFKIRGGYSIYGKTGNAPNPTLPYQFSYAASASFPLKNKLFLNVSQGLDAGQMLTNSNGVFVSILKKW